MQRVEKMVVVNAGQRVDRVEPMRQQRRDRGVAGGHLRPVVGCSLANVLAGLGHCLA